MPRTFISFLGATVYQKTQYYLKADRSDLSAPMYYVQEALLASQSFDWGLADKVWIFTTEEASENNYTARVISRVEMLAGEGLESALMRLKGQGRIPHFDKVRIPNGYSTTEMWEIFEQVFSKLREGDELYLDVTYGFRSLPMLANILVNYARALKNVQVKAIYYGGFDAGQEELKRQKNNLVLSPKPDDAVVQSPVFNLNVFTELQDWTYAAQSFLATGNTDFLAQLTKDTHPDFSKGMNSFSQAILTCRGKNLVQTEPIDELKDMIGKLGQNSGLQQQLKPLLEKVGEKIRPFRSKTTENGFAAVQWCIDHGMVQQGITFLEETLKSYIIETTIGTEFLNNFIYREAAKTALRGRNREIYNFTKKYNINDEISKAKINNALQRMYDIVIKMSGIKKYYDQLIGHTGLRNDINHCGFNDNPLTPAELNDKLKNVFNQIKPLLYAD